MLGWLFFWLILVVDKYPYTTLKYSLLTFIIALLSSFVTSSVVSGSGCAATGGL